MCAQLRDIWRQRNLTFDDYWNDQCSSSEDAGVEDVFGQIELGVESQEKVEPGDLQEVALWTCQEQKPKLKVPRFGSTTTWLVKKLKTRK